MFSTTSGLHGFLDAAAVQPVSLAAWAASKSCVFLSCRFEVLLAFQHEYVGSAVKKKERCASDLLSSEASASEAIRKVMWLHSVNAPEGQDMDG